MSDDVNIKISATDNATATLRAVQGEIGKFSASIKGIAALAVGGYGIQQLGSFLTDSFKAYGESERAVTMLDRVLKSTGNTIKMTRQQIQEYADARMSQTAFDDDAIVEAASQLARFRDISGDTFTSTLDAAQDLATVMGTDLVSATQMLGRAMSSPAEGLAKLARAGVLFTDAQKEQIKLLDTIGDKAGQQKIILAELQRQFGGAAVQDASTASGQIKQLSNAIGELKEAIGLTLANAILPLLKALGVTGVSAVTEAGKAIGGSQVLPNVDKLKEQADIERQIGILQNQLTKLSDEQRVRMQSWLGDSLTDSLKTQGRMIDLRNRMRELWNQREAFAGEIPAAMARANQNEADRRQDAGAGRIAAQTAVGSVFANIMAQMAEAMATDAGAIVGRKMFGLFAEPFKKERAQELDRSLSATESRFLTRGRGQLSMGEQKLIQEEQKTQRILERMAKSFEELGKGNLLLVEGIE